MEDLNARFYSFFDVLVHNKQVKDKADFASKCNISVSILTEIAKGRSKVGVKVIQSSVIEFDLNANWLLTGEGSMFLTDAPAGVAQHTAAPAAGGMSAELLEIMHKWHETQKMLHETQRMLHERQSQGNSSATGGTARSA